MRFVKVVLMAVTLFFALVVGGYIAANAAEVTLEWDANAATDLAGYKIYYSTRLAGSYAGSGLTEGDSPITFRLSDLEDIANPRVTLHGLGVFRYRFVATAFDENGNESGYSNEVFLELRQPDTASALAATYNGETSTLTLSWQSVGELKPDYWTVYYRMQGDEEWIEFERVEYVEAPKIDKVFDAVAAGEDKTVEFTVVSFFDGGTHSPNADVAAVKIDRQAPEPTVIRISVDIEVQ